MILTETQARNYLYDAGFKGTDLNKAVQIAFCESSFNTEAHNTKGEDSRGLMQINIHANPVYSSLDLFDPQINSMVAFVIYQDAGNIFKDWTCATKLGFNEKKNELIIFSGLAIVAAIVLYLS
jgi:hypothetical protein